METATQRANSRNEELADQPVCVKCGKRLDAKRDKWEVWLSAQFCSMACKLAHLRLLGLDRGALGRSDSR